MTGNGGYTGAPGESTCANCHSGNNPNIDGEITVSGLPSTILTGQIYPLTITITNPNGNAARAGFQMVLLNGSNGNAGSMSGNSSGSQLRNSGGKTYLGHSPATNFPASNEINFTVNWTAPANAGSNPVIKLFAVSVIANGNSGSSGDRVALTSFEVPIENAPAPLSVTINSIAPTFCSNSTDGQAAASPAGGNGPYNYLWNNGATTQINSSLPAGQASVTVTDNNGATASASVNIPAPPAINVTTAASPTCHNQANGSASASGTGGTGNLTYFWSNGATGNVITGLSPGTYTVTVEDVNGCTALASATVQSSAPININSNVTNVSCNGGNNGSISIIASGGNGGFSYQWSNGSNQASISNVTSGNYNLTITDNQGCSSTSTYTVTEPPVLQLQTSVTNPLCFGSANGAANALTSGGTAPYSYTWSTGQTGSGLTGLPAGSYSVTVTDSKGCTKNTGLLLTQPEALIIKTIASDTVLCAGESNGFVQLNTVGGTGNLVITWSNGDTGNTVDSLTSGNYVATVTDANNCSIAREYAVISAPALSVFADTLQNATCFGAANGMIGIDVEGGYISNSILWSTGDMDVPEINELPAGNYTVTITDLALCMVTDSFTVIQPNSLDVSIEVVNESETGSNDGSISISTSGGTQPYTIIWNNGDNNFTTDSLSAGLYTYVITDANECEISGQAVVNADNCLISVQADILQPTCADSFDGAIVLTYENPEGSYTTRLFKDQEEVSYPLDSLNAGQYSIEISDTAGCLRIFTGLALASVSPALSVDSIYTVPASGQDKNDGSAQLIISGGTGNVVVEWFFEEESVAEGAQVSNLSPGLYNISITDSLGCTKMYTIQIGVINSLNEIAKITENIIIYPNPVIYECAINNYLRKEISEIECIDASGSIVQRQQIITNLSVIKFQKSELGMEKPGIYLIRLWVDGMPVYKRMVSLD